MRRLLSIGFLLLYLGSFTELHQVMRLPLLVEHFVEHQSLVPQMSFLEFLVMHYKTDVPHDATDMSLPFKDCSHSVVTPTSVLPEQKIALSEQPALNTQTFSSFYFSFLPASHLSEIFQPPKA